MTIGMPYTHVVYIDEAGDEGFGKLRQIGQRGGQSKWLLLGAAIVRGEEDCNLPQWRNGVLDRFPGRQRRDLHFRDLKHEQRVVACQEISARPLFTCVTFSNKSTIPNSRHAVTFKRPGYLYNYLTRWLLERVTLFCEQDAEARGIHPCRIKVVFSRREGTDYQAMKSYMELMRDGRELIRPARSIRWNVFDPRDIVVENHSKWAGLQIADLITSSYFNAVEPNQYGNREVRYADTIRNLAICRNGCALNAGVTPVPGLVPAQPDDEERAFLQSFR